MRKTKKVASRVHKPDEAAMLAGVAVRGIQEKKGKEIVRLDLRNIKNSVTDYFVVCHGDSSTQVAAIARGVEEDVYKTTGELPWHKEGFENAEWILLDFISVVVHIFQEEKRRFYGIEKLWADAEVAVVEAAQHN